MPLKRAERLRGLPDLPYDVCEYIAQFLPDEDLQKLYCLNRAWYHISMATRHKEVALAIHWTRMMDRKTNGRISVDPPNLAPWYLINAGALAVFLGNFKWEGTLYERVDSASEERASGMMKIKHHYGKDGPARRDVVHTLITRFNRALLRLPMSWRSLHKALPGLARRHQSTVALRQLTSFVESMTGVNELTLTVEGLHGKIFANAHLDPGITQMKSLIQPFLASIWPKGFGSSLRSLTILVPMEFWEIFLNPSFQISRLDHFGVMFSKVMWTDALLCTKLEQLVELYLIPIIQRHRSTLSSLNIMSPYFDCAPFFQRAGFIPSLHTLKVEECGGLSSARTKGNFHHFLQRHRETILQLEWSPEEVDYEVLGQDIWFDLRYHELITLPNLKTLELKNMEGFSNLPTLFLSNVDRLLKCHSSTLTKLCLEAYNPYLNTLYSLLGNVASDVLLHFEIGTRALPRDLLAAMATKLPSLRFLRLSYQDVGRQTTVRVIHIGSASIVSYPILDFLMSNEDRHALGTECPLHALYKYHFLEDMKDFVLRDWPVEELYLEPTNKTRTGWEADAQEVDEAILRSLPNVVALNGRRRVHATKGQSRLTNATEVKLPRFFVPPFNLIAVHRRASSNVKVTYSSRAKRSSREPSMDNVAGPSKSPQMTFRKPPSPTKPKTDAIFKAPEVPIPIVDFRIETSPKRTTAEKTVEGFDKSSETTKKNTIQHSRPSSSVVPAESSYGDSKPVSTGLSSRAKPGSTASGKPQSTHRAQTPVSESNYDNVSVADSVADSSSISGARIKRTEAERKQYFENEPECGTTEAHRALCTRCNKWVRLSTRQTYAVRPWEMHRTRCDHKVPIEPTYKGLGLVAALPFDVPRTEKVRKALLEIDDTAEIVEPEQIKCKTCQQWVPLEKKYRIKDWTAHKSACRNNLIPVDIEKTLERKLFFLCDKQFKSFRSSSLIQCAVCNQDVALDTGVDYDLDKWLEHKKNCQIDANSPNTSISISPKRETRAPTDASASDAPPNTEFPVTSQNKPDSGSQPANRSPEAEHQSRHKSSLSTTDSERTLVPPSSSLSTLPSSTSVTSALASTSPSQPGAGSTPAIGSLKRKRESLEEDGPAGVEEKSSEDVVMDGERPTRRPRTSSYIPEDKDAPSGLGWFLLPFKAFVQGFKESLTTLDS
ncbi:hypothetical protein AN958_08875 [Leucoagaricus sp. SymC.cos]|nr:hypothetical protein AN958_08875 [Leucoagaricus sp. SymC.cos]